MVSSTTGAGRLSDDELSQLLVLIKQADSVEFKVTVPENDRFSSAEALGMDPLDAQIRQIYFFDTPDLILERHRLVVRARRAQDERDDLVVKLRPVVPDELPNELRRSEGFKVEVDAMADGFLCSGSLKETLGSKEIQAVLAGEQTLQSLFSKKQRSFYAAYAPEGHKVNDLSIFGPILVLRYQFSPEGFSRQLGAEMWIFPDNSRVLELSTRCSPPETLLARAETRAFLTERGIDLGGVQQTKTSKALELLSARLRTASGAIEQPGANASG